jgi:hypothetical protein
MPQNKDDDNLKKFFNRAEEEITKSGEEIARGVFQNLKANAQQNITQGIMNALTGGAAQQTPPPPTPAPQAQPRVVFQKQPNPQLNINQPGIRENLGWMYGGENGRPNPVAISAITDHFQYSGFLTKLNAGEYWYTYFRVSGVGEGGDFSHVVEILLDPGDNSDESGWVWKFVPGKDEIKDASWKFNRKYSDQSYPLPDYKPDQINELILFHDGKNIELHLNREQVRTYFTIEGAAQFVKMRVVGMSAVFWS